MTEQEIIDALRSSSFFHELPEDAFRMLAKVAKQVEYPGNTVIFHEHEPASEVLLVVSGKVALAICVTGKGCRQIMDVGDGELIGWSPLLHKNRLTDTARTVTPVKALTFDSDQLLKLCEENPSFGYEFMRRTAMVLSERLYGVRRQLIDVYGTNLPEVVLESD